jgi:hypothetical protein
MINQGQSLSEWRRICQPYAPHLLHCAAAEFKRPYIPFDDCYGVSNVPHGITATNIARLNLRVLSLKGVYLLLHNQIIRSPGTMVITDGM